MSDRIYYLGVVVTFLGVAGIAEAITGHGSVMASAVIMSAGIGMVLTGYIK